VAFRERHKKENLVTARRIMVQGTGSSVGKSLVSACLCRYFYEEGFRVAPFKAQNMSNNSYVTPDGGEVSRAQAFQAAACDVEPSTDMNPVLLKPSNDRVSQVVVLGRPVAVMNAREYHAYQPQLVGVIRESLERLSAQYDIVVIEGAGSPAEINLRPFDIVNMSVARIGRTPVILVGDIHAGGVFASLVGTLELLEPDERSLVKAFIINKFRGDLSLLTSGLEWLEAKTGKNVLGVLPFLRGLAIEEEDAIPEAKWKTTRPADPDKINIEVILLPHISNVTDFDRLEGEPDVVLRYLARVPSPSEPPPDLLILPGSKSTIADLAYLRSSGFARYVDRLGEEHVPIAGICGGYQMLGYELVDPMGVESEQATAAGLGLLEVKTTFARTKQTTRVRGRSRDYDGEVHGYEIHMGQTEAFGSLPPMFDLLDENGQTIGRTDGARSAGGLVWGTYLHGVFDAPGFRRSYLNSLRQRRGWPPIPGAKADTSSAVFPALSALVRNHLDLDSLHRIVNGN
jgi:adenosylcobyric acid synthase